MSPQIRRSEGLTPSQVLCLLSANHARLTDNLLLYYLCCTSCAMFLSSSVSSLIYGTNAGG
jgi:hypothetical protein